MLSPEAVCSWEGALVTTTLQRRKVLVLSGGPYIRNLLALIQQLDGRNGMDGEPLLDTIHRQEFDAIVLELRWPDTRSKNEVPGVKEIRLAWEGNLLVITAHLNGPQTLDVLEHYLIDGLPQAIPSLVTHPSHSTA